MSSGEFKNVFLSVHPDSTIFTLLANKASEIETELKHINRWGDEPLPPEKFENMGAFGSNTMTFEQWLQFVFLPQMHEMVETQGGFTGESSLSRYATRVFSGDKAADYLHGLLRELDNLINTSPSVVEEKHKAANPMESTTPPTIAFGSSVIPSVVLALIEVLPQFSGDDLEAQLQTYDAFLDQLSPMVRPQIAALLENAATKTTDEACRLRIQKAAKSVSEGGRAADPYNHDMAMKKYREDHKKSYDDQ